MPELLERQEYLAALDEHLERALAGAGRLVIVGGEAGVGKTSVVRRFADDHASDVRILWAVCDGLFTPQPLSPLHDLSLEVEGSARQVFASALEQLTAGPTLVVIEDVHWADEATLDLLLYLGRRLDRKSTLLVVTYRDDEVGARHPLRAVLGEVEQARRVSLRPLSVEGVRTLAAGSDVDPVELHRLTGGNPFFVTEALAGGRTGIPSSIRDAVLARIAGLSVDARTVVETIAVAGPELWLLESVLGLKPPELEECLDAGVLQANDGQVAFRHELARQVVEDAIDPVRRADFHARTLAAVRSTGDLARLAHHAEAAHDAEAVLEFAPPAADRAALLGAHREAAAQYARALRFGNRLSASKRAELLERRSRACYLTDQNDEAIETIEEALECRRELGDKFGEADALRWLSQILWCPGRATESAGAAGDAVAILEQLPPGRELAMAYSNLAQTYAAAARPREAVSWAERARELARRLGDTEIEVHALTTIGGCELGAKGPEKLEQALALAHAAGLREQAARTYLWLVGSALSDRRYDLVRRHLQAGIDYCIDWGLERDRLYLLAYRARLELDQGFWADAADSAAAVLRVSRSSIMPRILALVVLGLVRARRGDPGARALLDEAWQLAEPTGELTRFGLVASARAETSWLEGDRDAVIEATDGTLTLALERRFGALAGELADWRRRAGVRDDLPEGIPTRAAAEWSELGCPYEAALALADTDEHDALRRSHEQLVELGAQPAAAIVARRLRERGVTGIARGPRAATREHPAGLTRRECEVLELLGDGLTNAEIAARLVISEKTVGHHVSSILGKLGVRSRYDAAKLAAKDRELVPPR